MQMHMVDAIDKSLKIVPGWNQAINHSARNIKSNLTVFLVTLYEKLFNILLFAELALTVVSQMLIKEARDYFVILPVTFNKTFALIIFEPDSWMVVYAHYMGPEVCFLCANVLLDVQLFVSNEDDYSLTLLT